MALEYELTLAGATPIEQVAQRAFPDPGERPTGIAPLLSADLYDRLGFGAAVLAEPDGYVEAESDTGRWEWDPGACVSLTFEMDKRADPEWEATNMLTVVRGVLATGPEDAVLVFNDELLLLTRFDGTVMRHNRERWWSSYPAAEQLFPG